MWVWRPAELTKASTVMSDTDEGSTPLTWRRREREGPATWGARDLIQLG